MNTTKLIKMTVATAAIALLAQLQLPAQTWQTVDDFQYTAGKGAVALGAGLDTQGNLYTAGWADDAANIQHALVMRSSDQGVTWATIEDFNYRPGTNTCFYGFGVDPAQNLYAVGLATMGSLDHWIVRKSADHGATWTTADDFVPDSGVSDGRNWASGVAVDGAGNVYVVGMAHQRVGKSSYPYQFWVVRKSSNAGATWTTVDQYGYPNAPESVANAVLATSAGLFVCGLSVATSGRGPQWVVRKSANAGTTWTTVDNFYSSTAYNSPSALTADAAGNVYVGGFSDDSAAGGYGHFWWSAKGPMAAPVGRRWMPFGTFRIPPPSLPTMPSRWAPTRWAMCMPWALARTPAASVTGWPEPLPTKAQAGSRWTILSTSVASPRSPTVLGWTPSGTSMLAGWEGTRPACLIGW